MLLLLIIIWFPEEVINLSWDVLGEVHIVSEHNSFLDEPVDRPEFPDHLLALDGKTITIEGYVIPIQQKLEQEYFVLSRFPYQSCFFCGQAGPETVAEVYLKEQRVVTEQKVRVTGTLKLNPGDPLHLFYLIQSASVEKID